MSNSSIYEGLGTLGQDVRGYASPEEAVLERVANPHLGTAYLARFVAPEFTSLCPVTGQPDFAHLVIDYVPGDWLVESKSLKLFLTSLGTTARFTRIVPSQLASAWLNFWHQSGFGSGAIGILAAAYPLTYSLLRAQHQRVFGFPIKVCRPIVDVAK